MIRKQLVRMIAPASVLLALVLSSICEAQIRTEERVPTPFTEEGIPVWLELVVYKPVGTGPFPTLLFNHGSGGRGNEVARMARTWTHEGLAAFFNERGWLVAFLQRRGRGRSNGTNDEGFRPDHSLYSCAAADALPGVQRALQDIDAALSYLQVRPDVARHRVVVGGQSRGGVLAIAFAGRRPKDLVGAINFVGGWVGDTCAQADQINPVTFRQGSSFGGPTLWLYAANDSFYRVAHSRQNYEAFASAGGKGIFSISALDQGIDGHRLIDSPSVWAPIVAAFIAPL